MKKKKSAFWGNFWGETGRNTGKWTSNKIFGPNGWATPRRLIFDTESPTTKKLNSRSNKSRSSQFESELNQTNQINLEKKKLDLKEKQVAYQESRKDKIIEMAKKISFSSSDADDICSKLDELFLGANKAAAHMDYTFFNSNIFVPKIKSGIMRLNRINEIELAHFYQKQLNILSRAHFIRKKIPIIIYFIVLIISILWIYSISE